MRRALSVMSALLSMFVPVSAAPFVPAIRSIEVDLEALARGYC